MMVPASTQQPVVARAATAAVTVAPVAAAARREGAAARPGGATAREAPKIAPAEAMADRVAAGVDHERPEPGAQPALLAHSYAQRRKLGWLLPEPTVPDQRVEDRPDDEDGGEQPAA